MSSFVDKPFVAHGKEVLLKGEHYADAVNNDAAELIAHCLNKVTLSSGELRKEP